jgi:hemoglobin
VIEDPKTTTPFDALGGRDAVIALARTFYDAMEAHEPELTALHRCDAPGKVHPEARERFALFLVGWLGGPDDYVAQHGHPRLRMRHGRVAVNVAMRDAWLRSMTRALDARGIEGELRTFLDARFAEVADFLRNEPE